MFKNLKKYIPLEFGGVLCSASLYLGIALASGAPLFSGLVAGLIGVLPITQVIVRSCINIQSGRRTRASAILHRLLLLISIILIPTFLNKMPLAVLAVILLIVGYKLASPALFKQMFKLGKSQFVPFLINTLGIVFTDLLVGISLGLAIGVIVVLINSNKNSHFLHREDEANGENFVKITLAEEVTFLNKGAILKELDNLDKNTRLQLDVRKTKSLDYDILGILDEFAIKAKNRNITIKLISEKGIVENPTSYRKFFGRTISA